MLKKYCFFIVTLLITQTIHAESISVSINNGEYLVPGILSLPNNAKSKQTAALIMLHGTGTQKNEVADLYKILAEKLQKQNIASLRIDFAGNGDSEVSDLLYSLHSAVKDGKAALNYLKTHSAIDAKRIGVIGFSQGALIAQLLAIQEPTIKSMVVWSPTVGDGTAPMQHFYDQYYQQAKEQGHALIKYDWRTPFRVNLSWFEQLKAQRSLTEMKQYKGQLLAISGSNDTVLPWQNANTLIKATGSEDATAVVLKNADHIFNVFDPNAHQSKALLSITTEWLKLKL